MDEADNRRDNPLHFPRIEECNSFGIPLMSFSSCSHRGSDLAQPFGPGNISEQTQAPASFQFSSTDGVIREEKSPGNLTIGASA